MSTIPQHFAGLQQDAITWKASYLYNRAKDPDQKAAAAEAIAAMVLCMASPTKQAAYVQEIEQQIKLKKNWLSKTIEVVQKQRDQQQKKKQAAIAMQDDDEPGSGAEESKMPKWISKEDEMHWRKHGYFPCNMQVNDKKKIGYYSINVRQTEAGPVYAPIEISNFLVTPVMHVYKGDESRHIIEINNGYVNAVKEVISKIIPSREQFQASAVTEGSFVIFGSNDRWLRIASDLLHNFPRCIELEDLGYHPAGFFAYSDHIYIPGIGRIEVDKYGIFEPPVAGQNGKPGKYLLPQQSEAYMALQGTGADPFENDRVLTYKQSPVSFQRWCEMVYRVYGIQGAVGIAFCMFTIFRDIVAKVTGTSPHLYLFGPPQSGKSVLAQTIYSLFYVNRSFFIAYEGTVPAFYTYLTRFINCPAVINEVDANTTDPERLQAFKGAFDLEGREKMNIAQKTNKRSTTIQRINSSLILVGQHIVTNDDNALLTRSIIEDFLPNDSRTMDDKLDFDELDQLGKKGITSLLTDLLNIRPYFDANFRTMYLAQIGEWIKETTNKGKPMVQRIMHNYAIMATSYNILANHFTLPVPATTFTKYCLDKAKQWSAFVSSSDTLSEFWRFVSHLLDDGLITDGWDLEVVNQFKVDLRDGEALKFDAGEKILYIRLNAVHKVYQAEYRKRYSKDGMSIENLQHYFKAKKYYLGPVKQRQFKRYQNEVSEKKGTGLYPDQGTQAFKELKPQTTITSAHAFLYSEIEKQIEGFNLLRNEEEADAVPEVPADQKNTGWRANPDWTEK